MTDEHEPVGRTVRVNRIVPSPSNPMAVARAVVLALYTKADGLGLRYHRGLPYFWDGTCWPEIALRDVRRAVYHFLEDAEYYNADGELRPWAPTRRKLDDLMDALQAITLVESRLEPPLWTGQDFLRCPAREIVSMKNGLLHVPLRTLLSHTPQFFGHHALPFEFLPDAPTPTTWLEFLHELWPEDESSISSLQEVFGYLLAGGTSLQKIFLVVGPKRGGKGTMARILTGLLGEHNVAAPTLSSLATNFGISPLIGRPLAVIADARLSPRSENQVVVERLLSISGEDSLTIDRKYRDPWTGRLPTRFLILTNELPRLTDASGALVSRFIVFVLTKSFYGSENPALTDELLRERSGIFMWALAGLERLLNRGRFEQPQSSRDAIQRLDDLASPINAFLRARGRIDAEARVACDELWATFKFWCEGENRHPGTQAVFGRDLHAAVPSVRRVRPRDGDQRYYEYVGIGLAGDNNTDHGGPLGPSATGPDGPSRNRMFGHDPHPDTEVARRTSHAECTDNEGIVY